MKINYIDTVYQVLENWYLKFAELTPKLIVGLIVFSLFYFSSTYFSRLIAGIINKRSDKIRSFESIKTLINIIRFLFILIGTFIAFEIMGFSSLILKFIGSLGVAGIIAGVALKDIVSSMFSGMLVSIDKSFKDGDYVQINGISGTIEDVGFLTTKLIADDGRKYYIPNQLIFSSPFINFTASGHRKVIMDFEIPNTEDLEKAKLMIKDEVKKLPFVDKPDEIQVVFNRQNLGIFNLSVRFWLKQGENVLVSQSEAYVKLKNRMDAEGISMVNPNAQNNTLNS